MITATAALEAHRAAQRHVDKCEAHVWTLDGHERDAAAVLEEQARDLVDQLDAVVDQLEEQAPRAEQFDELLTLVLDVLADRTRDLDDLEAYARAHDPVYPMFR
jgi:hypothetical protein